MIHEELGLLEMILFPHSMIHHPAALVSSGTWVLLESATHGEKQCPGKSATKSRQQHHVASTAILKPWIRCNVSQLVTEPLTIRIAGWPQVSGNTKTVAEKLVARCRGGLTLNSVLTGAGHD